MTSLLAFILVASSSRGHQLVYSFPPDPKPVKRTSKPTYPSFRLAAHAAQYYPGHPSSSDESGNDEDDDDDNSSSSDDDYRNDTPLKDTPSSSSLAPPLPQNLDDPDEQASQRERKKLDNYLGFPNTVLANLLCPNRELCDQPFELVVDHLAFVGHPVWLGDDEVLTRPGEALNVPTGPKEDQDEEESDEEEDGYDEEESRGRSRKRKEVRSTPRPLTLELEEGLEERGHTVVPGRPGSSPIHFDNNGTPTSLSTSRPRPPEHQSSITSSQQSHTSIHGSGRVTSFNFVCVIDTPPDSHLSSHLEGYYKDVVVPITANLKALERKEKWLGKESAKLRKARETFAEKGRTPTEHIASLPTISSLAASISRLFASLKTSAGSANIIFSSLPVQVLLRGELPVEDDDLEDELREKDELRNEPVKELPEDANGQGLTEQDEEAARERARSVSPVEEFRRQRPPLFSRMRRRPPVRFQPWETLLLLEDVEDLKANVLEGSLLWRFLEICDPTLSFAEYETLLDVDQDELSMKQIVEHFLHWRKARIIDVVSLKGVYALSTSFDIATLATLVPLFKKAFPLLPPLPLLLARLKPTEPFSTIVTLPSLRNLYVSALIWLLQHEVVEKQHAYVRLTVSEDVKKGARMMWGSMSSASASGGTDPSRKGSVGGAGIDVTSGGRSLQSYHSTGEESSGSTGAGSNSSAGALGGTRLVRHGVGRPDFEDTKAMAIVGSVLSNSPPVGMVLSRSSQSNRSFGATGRRRTLTSQSQKGKAFSGTTYSSVDERNEEVEKGPSIILEPGRPSAVESKWISEICREKEKTVVDKFEKMVRMLNGSYHLDEIRYRASISRKDIKIVLTAFSENLIIFTHPRTS
ncbi:hypothetical protein T439DRAFT_353332 [Meredithblackwellia eburnea MCA 4105]